MRDFLTYIILMGLWAACCVKCTHGWMPDQVDPNEGDPQELVIDSCAHQIITTPNFVSVSYLDRIPLTDVTLTWGAYTTDWVKDGEFTQTIEKAVREVTINYMTYDSMIVLDETAIDGNTLIIDFAIYFRKASTGAWSNWNLNHPFIHFKYEGIGSATLIKGGQRSINLGSLVTDSQDWTIDLIETLPSWAWFNMRYAQLDSTQADRIWQALLANCKTDARVDTTGFPISQERIDQFLYQGIIMQ